jgi:hypothetical protein
MRTTIPADLSQRLLLSAEMIRIAHQRLRPSSSLPHGATVIPALGWQQLVPATSSVGAIPPRTVCFQMRGALFRPTDR